MTDIPGRTGDTETANAYPLSQYLQFGERLPMATGQRSISRILRGPLRRARADAGQIVSQLQTDPQAVNNGCRG